MIATLDPTFATALRRELVGRAGAAHRPWWRRRTALVGAGVVVGVALAGWGGGAIAGRQTLPGGEEVTALAPAVTATASGTTTVDLGPRPEQATKVRMYLWCLSAGTLLLDPRGASLTCTDADVDAASALAGAVEDLAPGQTTWTFTADPAMSYKVMLEYVSSETLPWGVNADGHTFGVANEHGSPELVGVIATNGRTGYAWGMDLDWASNGGGPAPTSPAEALARQAANEGKAWVVPVYESDGKTVVGEFISGDWDAPTFVYLDGHTAPGHNPQR